MREIKFRAWDKKDGSWIPPEDVAIESDGKILTTDGSMPGFFLEEVIDIIISQFTGLLDKNGKESFVGDIWKVTYRGTQLLFQIVDELHWCGYVFTFQAIRHNVSCVHANVDEDGEVIGNIYENPELLEAK
jgi:uncharacterized phage protein (TIGR01671 family)